MKINNISHINALVQEHIKDIPLKSLQASGDMGASTTPSGLNIAPARSQISQLLTLINLFPFLYRSDSSSAKLSPLLSQLAAALLPPKSIQQAAKWLAQQEADKALHHALNYVLQHQEDDVGGKTKGLLMLLAEQRLNEQTKTGEYHWLFPFRNEDHSPVRVAVKKKQAGKRKRQIWCVTVNLSLSKNRHLTATAELEDQTLRLTMSTDAAGLQQQIENALPTLEKALASHNIALTQCEFSTTENVAPATLHSGVDIQV